MKFCISYKQSSESERKLKYFLNSTDRVEIVGYRNVVPSVLDSHTYQFT